MSTYTVRLVCEEGIDPLTGEALGSSEETLAVEAPTPWDARSVALSRANLRARGRLLRAYDAETEEEIMRPAPAELRRGQFVIDGLPGTYTGRTRGDTWNGFAVPYFDLAEARRIADDYAAQPATLDGQTRAEYDPRHDVIRLFDPSADEWNEIRAVHLGGAALYPVGAHTWAWEEASG